MAIFNSYVKLPEGTIFKILNISRAPDLVSPRSQGGESLLGKGPLLSAAAADWNCRSWSNRLPKEICRSMVRGKNNNNMTAMLSFQKKHIQYILI
jgi:hypothetical protein